MKDLCASDSTDTLETLSVQSNDSLLLEDDLEFGLLRAKSISCEKEQTVCIRIARRFLTTNFVPFFLALLFLGLFQSILLPSSEVLEGSAARKLFTGPIPTRMADKALYNTIYKQAPKAKITVRLQETRIDFLFQAIERVSRCASVEYIQIEGDRVPATVTKRDKIQKIGDIKTDGVLLLEDTVDISCEAIFTAIKEWRHNPGRSVGFFPLQTGDSYTLLSDKALLIHRIFAMDTIPTQREERHECQPYVASARAYVLSNKLPVGMRAPIAVREKKAFTPTKDLDCNKLVSDALGGVPLVKNTIYYTGRTQLQPHKFYKTS